MSRYRQSDTIISWLAIIGGALLVIWGISPFIASVLQVVLGFILINYGLGLRRLPPLTLLVRYWLMKLR